MARTSCRPCAAMSMVRPLRTTALNIGIVEWLEERWYQVDVAQAGGRWRRSGPTAAGNRQFVLADPDGYLWRPFTDLGERPPAEG